MKSFFVLLYNIYKWQEGSFKQKNIEFNQSVCLKRE